MNDGQDDGKKGETTKEEEGEPVTDRQPPLETVRLKPLAEVLPPGQEGAQAFEQLMHAALAAWGQRAGFRYESDGGWRTGRAPAGVPGMEGEVSFVLGGADLLVSGGSGPERTPRVLMFRALDPERAGLSPPAGRSGHLVFLSPRAGGGAPDVRGGSPDVTMHHWGFERVEPLLRACPSLLVRDYPEEAESALAGYDGFPYRDMKAAVRRAAVTAYAPLRTLGLPANVLDERAHAKSPSLADVFVPLRLFPRGHTKRQHTVAEVLEQGSSCVILGDPGSGKTTLLLYLALLHAGGVALGGAPPQARWPLYVPLRELTRARAKRPGMTIVDFLAERARERDQIQRAHPALFEAALRLGDAIVFFDGLDEVGSEPARRRVADDVKAFRAMYPRSPVWVTSRKYGYTSKIALPEADFRHFHIAGLDTEEVDRLVDRWYAAREPVPGESERLARQLQQAITRAPSVRRLAQNPLLLTLMALIHQTQKKLPRDRGELYEQCVTMLLKTWHDAKREEDDRHVFEAVGLQLRPQTQKDYLAHLAMHIQEKNDGAQNDEARGLVQRSEALEVLAKRHLDVARRGRPDMEIAVAREEMDEFLGYVADRTGLLVDRGGGMLSFIHLSFQEYLAAWVYTCGGTPDPAFFEQRIGHPAWEEVLLLRLYIVLNGPGNGAEAFDAIVNRVMRGLEKQDRAAAWLTLARALRDNLDFRPGDRRAILERALAEWLAKPAFAGDWFDVLLEMTLFTESLVPSLREVLVQAIRRRPTAESVAVLHLATRLVGFPSEAIGALESRSDLAVMRADLCAFAGSPEAAPLLRGAGAGEWSTMLEAIDAREAYGRTSAWIADTAPPTGALAGATIWLWRNVLSDMASRTAFAAKRGKDAQAGRLFTAGETLRVKGWKYAVDMPYGGLRAPAKSPGPPPTRPGRILCAELAVETMGTDSGTAKAPWGAALRRWTITTLRRQLDRFSAQVPVEPDRIEALADLFVRDFGPAFVRDFGPDFGRAFVRDFGRDFGRAFGRAFGPAFGRAFGRDFVRDLGRDFGPAFGVDFVRAFGVDFGVDFGRDFVRAFGRNFSVGFVRDLGRDYGLDPDSPVDIATQWDRALANDDTLLRLLTDARLWAASLWSYSADLAVLKEDCPTPGSLVVDNPFALSLALAGEWTASVVAHYTSMSRDLLTQLAVEKVTIDVVGAWLARNPFDALPAAVAWGHQAEIFHERGISLKGERGVLVLAHAAYAACRAGFIGTSDAWQTMLAERDTSDPRIEAAYLLYRIASFEDTDGAVVAWKKLVQNPPPELRPLFHAAGILAPPPAIPPSQATGLQAPSPTPSRPSETASMPAWFETAPFPWADPRAPRLRDLLVAAYEDVATARVLARSAGIRTGAWNTSGGPEAAWNSLLETAAAQAALPALLGRVLEDDNVRGHHPTLRDLMKDTGSPVPATGATGGSNAEPTAGRAVAGDSSKSGLAAKDAGKPSITAGTTSTAGPTPPIRTPEPEKPFFSWLHLSDIHFGQGNAARGWNQELVLDALARDTAKLFRDKLTPAPQAIFVTGDIAYAGKAAQYEKAATWLEKVASSVGLTKDRIYLVPGNHDVDREADKDRATKRLVRALRDGADDLDDALKDATDRALLTKRIAAYLEFAKGFGSPADIHWSIAKDLGGATVKVIGLNTSLLAGDSEDHGNLRLGNEQLALLRDTSEDQLTLVLTHHPFAEGWLRDERDARGWAEQRADIHLCGHVHDADALARRTGGGTGIVTVVAGAAHGDKPSDGAPETHGYNWAAVFRGVGDRPVLRVWPRVWNKRMDFRLDVSHVPDGKLFAEHPLPRLRLPAQTR